MIAYDLSESAARESLEIDWDEFEPSNRQGVHLMDSLAGEDELTGEKKYLSTTFIEGDPKSSDLIIMMTPWAEDPHRDFEITRNKAVAEATGADVLVVGNPGIGFRRSMTKLERLGLLGVIGADGEIRDDDKHSTFWWVGRAIATAADNALNALGKTADWKESRFVVLDCYSLGNNTGAAVISQLPNNLRPNLVLWREIADRLEYVPTPAFRRNFIRRGGVGSDQYHANNERFDLSAQGVGASPAAFIDSARRFLASRRELWHDYPSGIASGSVREDLKLASEMVGLNDDMQHVQIWGADSPISLESSNEKLNRLLKVEAGVGAVAVRVPLGTHAMREDIELNAALTGFGMNLVR